MKLILLIVFFSSHIFSQQWLPMSVGNQWQYLRELYGGGFGYELDDINITNDTIINNQNYYKFTNYQSGNWLRYDSINNIEFVNFFGMDYTIMDFRLSPMTLFYHYYVSNSNYLDSILATTIEGQYNSGDSVLSYKGYNTFQAWGFDYDRDSIKYIQDLGIISEYYENYFGGYINTLIQSKIQKDSNIIYFKQFYYPTIIFEPETLIVESVFNKDVTVNHRFSRLNYSTIGGWSEGVNFIDSVYLICFYSKDSLIVDKSIHIASRIPVSYKFNFNFELDTVLMKQGYEFKYKIKAVDKFWIPNCTYLPINQYFTLKFDTTLTNKTDDTYQTFYFYLYQNYPNPFNPTTKINWQQPSENKVTLKVYDILGREVSTLINEVKPAGIYETEFNASNLASGIYYYQLKSGNFVEIKKMILLK
jgi:hypothetical protein